MDNSDLRSATVSALRPFGTLIYARMSRLAGEHDAVNLAQGFPEEDGPLELRRRAAAALLEGPNQYVSSWGLPALRRAIAERSRRYYGVAVDPERGEALRRLKGWRG